MTESDRETTMPPGSEGIPGRRGDGSAGSSREVTGPDAMASCTVGTGQENTHNGTAGQEQKESHPAPRMVERKTELRGLGIAPLRRNKGTIRKKTEQDLKDPDPEVPYIRFEAAARGMVCALIERQDRMNEELFARLNDLRYRQDDLEATVGEPGHRRSG